MVNENSVWPSMTTLNGIGAQPKLVANGAIDDWLIAPLEFDREEPGTSETFVKHDGDVVVLIDVLDRVLHPRRIIEAEQYSAVAPGGGPIQVVSNNQFNLPPLPNRQNGGISVANIRSGTTLTYSNLASPEPTVGALKNYRYRARLRASNVGTVPATVTITVTQGATVWTDVFTISVTADVHDYVVVDSANGTSSASPLTLASDQPFSVSLSLVGVGAGPCAFDDALLESEGVPR